MREGLPTAPAGHQRTRLRSCWHIDRDVEWIAPARHRDAQHGRNSRRLNGVEFAYTARHEKALDKAENGGDTRPEEAAVENPQAGSAQVEVVNAESAQKQRQQNADDFVAAHRLILLVKDGLRVGIRLSAHGWFSLLCRQYTQASRPRFPQATDSVCTNLPCRGIQSNMGIQNASASGTFLIGGDLPVNRLGYGTMRLVGEGAWGEPADAAEARRVLRRAVELGVTLIDTADAYGPEIAERLIAEALHPYAPGVVIATKGGNTRPGPARAEPVGRAGYLIQCVEMSLRRLKLDRIDLYQLHRIDPRTPLEESLGALKKMQQQGKIRHIGLSEVTPAEIEEAQKFVRITTVQNRYSLADRRHEETLNYCERQGIGFLPWYPINAGKLLKADNPSAQTLAQIAAHHAASVAQLSLGWLLQRSPVMLPIPGTSKVAHLEENIAAAELKLSQEEWAEIEAAARS